MTKTEIRPARLDLTLEEAEVIKSVLTEAFWAERHNDARANVLLEAFGRLHESVKEVKKFDAIVENLFGPADPA